MANPSEVLETLTMLMAANLSFPPVDVHATAKVWSALLKDVPAETLTQAATDHILTDKEFPKLSEIRKAALQVKVHNGASAAPNPFGQPVADIKWGLREQGPRVSYPKELDALLLKDHETWTAIDHALYQRTVGGPLFDPEPDENGRKVFSQASDDFWLSLQEDRLCTT